MPANNEMSSETQLLKRIEILNEIGIRLSRETNLDVILQNILQGAMDLTNADAGSLYLVTPDQKLEFFMAFCHTLDFVHVPTRDKNKMLSPIALYLKDGSPNYNNVIACSILRRETINVEDAYEDNDFDFSGTRLFDERTGYHSTSFLTVPMKNHEGEITGGFQLINAMDEQKNIIPFSAASQHLTESLASQAAIILTNKGLIEAQRLLFDSFIQMLARAIDEKSAHTSNHCSRVPVVALMLADAAQQAEYGIFRYFHLSEEEMYELRVGAWLHDCGKLSTPIHIIDKKSKLETVYDRLQLIQLRCEILRRDALIRKLKSRATNKAKSNARYQAELKQIAEDLALIQHANQGREFMAAATMDQLLEIASRYQWQDLNNEMHALLTEDELHHLNIRRGTLTADERKIIENHVKVTYEMLSSLPFPKNMRRVPEIAASHHERLDGSGYPRGLHGDQLSMQARIVAIADVFEALTAADRPYKSAMKLSEALKILGNMRVAGHIDADLFDVFIRKKVYLQYAKQYLCPEQLDEVDESKIPGFQCQAAEDQ